MPFPDTRLLVSGSHGGVVARKDTIRPSIPYSQKCRLGGAAATGKTSAES